jgi:hypothetical protein
MPSEDRKVFDNLGVVEFHTYTIVATWLKNYNNVIIARYIFYSTGTFCTALFQ